PSCDPACGRRGRTPDRAWSVDRNSRNLYGRPGAPRVPYWRVAVRHTHDRWRLDWFGRCRRTRLLFGGETRDHDRAGSLAPRRRTESMKSARWMNISERWFRLLLRLYPPDFRDELGESLVETYRDRAHEALRQRGIFSVAVVWCASLHDSLLNGLG